MKIYGEEEEELEYTFEPFWGPYSGSGWSMLMYALEEMFELKRLVQFSLFCLVGLGT